MQLDSENDRQLLLAIMKDANIKGAYAVPFALLMDRIATATVPAPPKDPAAAEAELAAAAKTAARGKGGKMTAADAKKAAEKPAEKAPPAA